MQKILLYIKIANQASFAHFGIVCNIGIENELHYNFSALIYSYPWRDKK